MVSPSGALLLLICTTAPARGTPCSGGDSCIITSEHADDEVSLLAIRAPSEASSGKFSRKQSAHSEAERFGAPAASVNDTSVRLPQASRTSAPAASSNDTSIRYPQAVSAVSRSIAVVNLQAERANAPAIGSNDTATRFAQAAASASQVAAKSPGAAPGAAAIAGWQSVPVQAQDSDALSWAEHPMQRLWALLAGLTFAAFIKGACLLGNVLVQVSPFPAAREWKSKGSTGEADAAPYIAIAYNGYQWSYYGTFAYFLTGKSGFLILVQSNCLGAVLGSFYVYTFFRNCSNPCTRANMIQYVSAYSMLAGFQVCASFALPAKRALFLSGMVSSLCSYIGAISMLVTVPLVLRTQNSSSIPGMLVVANFAGAVVWTICGMMLADPMVIGPNIFCAVACTLCICLRLRYPVDVEVGKGGCALPRPKMPYSKRHGAEHCSDSL